MRLQGPDRELLCKLTNGWPPAALPADTLDGPTVWHLRANDLIEIVEGKVQATQAGFDLRAFIETKSDERAPRPGQRDRGRRHRARRAGFRRPGDGGSAEGQ